MLERRAVHRGRTYLGGQIAFNARSSTMDCLVRNLSQFGAKLEFPSTSAVPDTFDIMIRHRGESRRAYTIWRSEVEAGIAFVQAESCVVISIETARKIKQLEKDKATLAQRVAQLSQPF